MSKSVQIPSTMQLFSLHPDHELSNRVAKYLNLSLSEYTLTHFSDGEIQVQINESVRGKDVFLIHTMSDSVNDALMELLITIDALKRGSAHSIYVVLTYYPYARQDRKSKSREPVSAKLVANLIKEAGADHLILLDIHEVQLQGFFDIPVDHLDTIPLFATYYRALQFYGDDFVVVAPSHSGTARAYRLAQYLDTAIAIIDTQEHKDQSVIGDVVGKRCILVDDLIDTGYTYFNAANILHEAGAKKIYGCASHGVFSPSAQQYLDRSYITSLCMTDSIDWQDRISSDKIVYLSIDQYIAKAISTIYQDRALHPWVDHLDHLLI